MPIEVRTPTTDVAAAPAQESEAEASDLTPADEEKEGSKKKDPSQRLRVLPVPTIISEPAIGYGLGVGIGFIHPTKEGDVVKAPLIDSSQGLLKGRAGQKKPPRITGIGLAYTDKETWGVGVAHFQHWKDDSIRYVGAVAYADVKATMYLRDTPFDFAIDGYLVYQDLKFRLKSSRWFLGGSLQYLDAKADFGVEIGELPPVDFGGLDSTNAALGAELMFEGLDNAFTPNRGQRFKLKVKRFDDSFGGDYDYWDVRLKCFSFHELGSSVILGLRAEVAVVDGRAPFYGFPWVSLRGIPALRYRGERTAVAEVEARWNLAERWAVVGFGGLGWQRAANIVQETTDSIYNYGIGGRYHLMPDLGLWIGVDIARGPEETIPYVQIGHAW